MYVPAQYHQIAIFSCPFIVLPAANHPIAVLDNPSMNAPAKCPRTTCPVPEVNEGSGANHNIPTRFHALVIRSASILFVRNTRSVLSVVPINCVSGLVPALPERDHDESAGDNHTGIPPDIESTSPLDPLVRPIVFPTRVSQLLKVRRDSLVATTPESVEREPEREVIEVV